MPWYAAHAIIYFEHAETSHYGYQVYENVFLVQADTPQDAASKARVIARRDEGDDSGSLRVGDRLAKRVFGGIRAIVEVSHERSDGQLGDGDEVTYSRFVVADRPALEKLIRGDDVDVLYVATVAASNDRSPAEAGDDGDEVGGSSPSSG